MSEIWSELRRRNIFRVAVAYVVLSWVILQATGLIAPGLGLPDWTFPLIFLLLMAGFPVALFFAWAFELTPEGLKRTGDVDRQASETAQTGRKFDFIIIGVLSVALLFFVVDRLLMAPTDTPAASQEVARSSIAVLPFVNMSNDPDQVYFSDGISEEILNVLAQIPDLHVTSRSSAFQFRGNDIHIPTVAEQLGVANILEGSVRRSGTRVRITAQLIDASTDRHLWAENFERELTDIFVIQDEVSRAIVDALYVHLGIEAPTTPKVKEANVEAYRLYLLGRHNFEQRTQETLYKAIDLFDQAITIDPDYAPAYAGKADAYMLLKQSQYGDILDADSLALAEPLIERALKLDPNLAEAYASKGLHLADSSQFEDSVQAFDRAIELNPNLARAWHWSAISFGRSADYTKALKSWKRAHDLDPLSPVILEQLIWKKIQFRQLQEADLLLKRLRATTSDSTRINPAALTLQRARGNWAALYLVATQLVEEKPIEWIYQEFAFAQLALKALDPETRGFSKTTMTHANSFYRPDLAWQTYQDLPASSKGDLFLTNNITKAGIRLERYADVIELWRSVPRFTDSFPGALFNDQVLRQSNAPSLVLSRQKTGDEVGAKELLATTETFISLVKQQGITGTLSELEAMVHALKGEDDAVIASLEQAHKDGYLTWYRLNYPFYDAVRDREDFQAIVRAVDARVNEERAKLGWDPVE